MFVKGLKAINTIIHVKRIIVPIIDGSIILRINSKFFFYLIKEKVEKR